MTPTCQIVGTQAVINVLAGERYRTITKETAGVMRGEYGRAPVNRDLQQRVLAGAKSLTVRPANLLGPELETVTSDLTGLAEQHHVELADAVVEERADLHDVSAGRLAFSSEPG